MDSITAYIELGSDYIGTGNLFEVVTLNEDSEEPVKFYIYSSEVELENKEMKRGDKV